MKGTLHLQVIGGLASRLRCIAAAIAYTQRSGKSLRVDWWKKDKAQKLGTFDVSLDELWDGPYTVTSTQGCWGAQRLTPSDERESALDVDGDVWIRTDSPYKFGRWCDLRLGCWLRRHMKPTRLLADRIAALTAGLPSPLLGVHVRDANISTQRAPDLEWYKNTLADRPLWPIYLCTDSQRAVDWFAAQYGGRVLMSKREDAKPVGTYNWAGIVQCAAELYLLADHCGWVLGSVRSSYSELVALMRGAEKTGPSRNALSEPNVRGGDYEDAGVPPDEAALERIAKEAGE